MSDVESRVKEVLRSVLGDEVDAEVAYGENKAWDSLAYVMIVSGLEGEFGFEFTPDELTELTSASTIVDIVSKKLAA